jgi:5-methylthioadenosine/S-adenosylhomocysteine deaminase
MTVSASKEPLAVDQVIAARWVVPVEPAETVLEHHSLVIDAGRIIDLLPTDEASRRYIARRHFSLNRHVLMPGLINLHTHAAMALLRGYADDMPLMRWLQERIWPAEGHHVSAAFVRDGTLLAAWEMLRGGVTCFNDMYFFPEAAAEAAREAGIRAALGITAFEFPSPYGKDADDYLAKGLQARERFLADPLLSFCLAPHAPYTVSDRTFEKVGDLSAQLKLPIHIHVHETLEEIEGGLKEHGIRPMARLQRVGLLGRDLIAVHAIHLDPEEIALLADAGCHVAHCPTSNMKLASGIAPVRKMLERGIGIGLGTDGAASNNRLDLFQEMRHAALLAKVANNDPSLLPAHQALRMATLESARALGIDALTGSLQPGKAADLAAVSLEDWMLKPCFDPVSHLVYAAGRESVSHVWVAGKLRIDDKIPLDLDERALLDKVEMWQNSLLSCR